MTDLRTAETADLLIQLGRAAYIDCSAGGLTQAQWLALRFFSRANRFSRTISGFAQFHATTRGTASQTVKILVEKGYLIRTPSEKDARSIRFDLTAKAHKKMSDDPLEAIVQVAGRLSPAERNRMNINLRSMLAGLRQGCRQPVSGVCRMCGHLDRGKDRQDACCRLMQEPLDDSEFDELCIRYEPGD